MEEDNVMIEEAAPETGQTREACATEMSWMETIMGCAGLVC